MPNPLGVLLRNRRAGRHTLVWARAEFEAPENFTLSSPAFGHGAAIPERYRGHFFGHDVSPALEWTTPPAETAELVLIVQDPDVPGKTSSTHLLATLDPGTRSLADDALAKTTDVSGLTHGRGALGHLGWAGPMPVPSHGPHSYVFQLFALDVKLGLPTSFTLDALKQGMTGHVIGRAQLEGTYEIA